MNKTYKHLTALDRQLIGKLKKSGKSFRQIASTLGVAPSTISREFKRGFTGFGYCCHFSHDYACNRRYRANWQRRKLQEPQVEFIRRQLDLTLSPEQIASLFPSEFGFSISAKTIYNYIHSFQASRGNLHKKLRRRSQVKRRNWRRYSKPKAPPTRITERPQSIVDRTEFGHWEMDLFHGKHGTRGAALVLVERKSRYTLIVRLPDRTARSVQEALRHSLKRFVVKSITTDNGSEFVDEKALRSITGADIYYCHPYHAWEKGLVENTIGLFRYFFPKGEPLPPRKNKFKKAQRLLNNRPRKAIGFATPHSLLDNFFN